MKLIYLLGWLIVNLQLIAALYANTNINSKLAILHDAQPWASIPSNKFTEESKALVETLLPILDLNTDTIRSLLVEFLASEACRDGGIGDEYLTTDCLSTAFILNRMIWEFPEEIPDPYPPRFGGFLMPQEIYSDPIKRMLWPFAKDEKNGTLFLEGECEGHMGPLYQAIEEFDYFSKHFKRREATEFSQTQ